VVLVAVTAVVSVESYLDPPLCCDQRIRRLGTCSRHHPQQQRERHACHAAADASRQGVRGVWCDDRLVAVACFWDGWENPRQAKESGYSFRYQRRRVFLP
jgi:hypothetical protein